MNKTDTKIKEALSRFREKFVNHGEFIYNKGSYPATCGEIEQFLESELSLIARESYERGYKKGIAQFISDVKQSKERKNDE